MFSFLMGTGLGLILGWHFIPQPAWAATLITKVVDFIKSKFTKTN